MQFIMNSTLGAVSRFAHCCNCQSRMLMAHFFSDIQVSPCLGAPSDAL
jgi:hypothetical protein